MENKRQTMKKCRISAVPLNILISCACCLKNIGHKGGRRTTIKSEKDADICSKKWRRLIRVGNTICHSCQLRVLYEKRKMHNAAVYVGDQASVRNHNTVAPNPCVEPIPCRSRSSITTLGPGTSLISALLGSQSSSSTGISQGSSDIYEPPKTYENQQETLVTMDFNCVVATKGYCFICSATDNLKVVPLEARLQAFAKRRIYIPKLDVCCKQHLIKNRFYADVLEAFRIVRVNCDIPISDVGTFLQSLSDKSEASLFDRIGDESMPEKQLRAYTGYGWDEIHDICSLLTSIRKSDVRNVTQALVVFLYKLRYGLSNEHIAATFNISHPQSVSDYCASVMNSFCEDVLPNMFGPKSITRREIIEDHTSPFVEGLFGIKNQVVMICDGTYIRHQKSNNNAYQRKSYSVHKHTTLCKPFTMCCTDGYVLDVPGPYTAGENDATILRKVLSDPAGIITLLRKGDVFVLDRGFRDCKDWLIELGFTVLMPSLKKPSETKFQCIASNQSRLVTKIRWVVEAVHGVIGKKFQLLHHQLDNKLLPRIGEYVHIANFLYNRYVPRLRSDIGMEEQIIARMKSRLNEENSLADEVAEGNWRRRRVMFLKMSSNEIDDFPEWDEDILKLFFTGSYQFAQGIAYLQEAMQKEGDFSQLQLELFIHDDKQPALKTLKIKFKSRHSESKVYCVCIRYEPNNNTIDGVVSYCCDCLSGLRTVGSCAHVAAILYYLSNGRYQSQILRPNEVLTNLFNRGVVGSTITVADNSDDEDGVFE